MRDSNGFAPVLRSNYYSLIPNTMNDLITIQGLQDALNLSMREVKDLRDKLEITEKYLHNYVIQAERTIDTLMKPYSEAVQTK